MSTLTYVDVTRRPQMILISVTITTNILYFKLSSVSQTERSRVKNHMKFGIIRNFEIVVKFIILMNKLKI